MFQKTSFVRMLLHTMTLQHRALAVQDCPNLLWFMCSPRRRRTEQAKDQSGAIRGAIARLALSFRSRVGSNVTLFPSRELHAGAVEAVDPLWNTWCNE